MKKFVIIALSMLFSYTVQSQDTGFEMGTSVINLGIGLGGTYYSGSGYSGVIPPVSFSYEKGIKDGIFDKGIIGAGAYLGYTAAKWEYSDSYGSYSWTYSNILIGARGSLHYPLIDGMDTYVGLILGYDIDSSKEYSSTGYYESYTAKKNSHGGIFLSGYLGGRYWMSDELGIMAELGYGIAYLNVGAAIKL